MPLKDDLVPKPRQKLPNVSSEILENNIFRQILLPAAVASPHAAAAAPAAAAPEASAAATVAAAAAGPVFAAVTRGKHHAPEGRPSSRTARCC